MNFLDSLICPWKNNDLWGVFLYISLIILYSSIAGYYIISRSKKIRDLAFKKNYIYVALFSCNVLTLFNLMWYASLPVDIFASIVTYRMVKQDLEKSREQELMGGWSCNKKYREQQIKAFKMKSPEEQEKELEYYINHPLKLNPVLVTIIGVLVPIAITLCLWALGVGYRWHYYPFV